MKRLFFLLAALVLMPTKAMGYEIYAPYFENSAEPYVDSALSVIVIDADSGRILYGKDIDTRLPMASTTKIMTALIALEQDNIDEKFIVDPEAIIVEGSSMGLLEGDVVDLRTLAYGMLLPSGNDAANVTAVKIGGDATGFAEIMNERADELGLFDTHFVTPSGLDAPSHYTTARDLANLTRYALDNADFREICALSEAKVEFGNPPFPRMLYNYNKLLERYDGAIGVKTGLTDDAGRCLVSAVEKEGIELITITLNCSNDYEVHTMLYDYFFERLHYEGLDIAQIEIPVVGLEEKIITAVAEIPYATLYEGESDNLTISYNVSPMLFAPIYTNDCIGSVEVYSGEDKVFESALYAQNSAEIYIEEKKSLFNRLLDIIFNVSP